MNKFKTAFELLIYTKDNKRLLIATFILSILCCFFFQPFFMATLFGSSILFVYIVELKFTFDTYNQFEESAEKELTILIQERKINFTDDIKDTIS